MVAFSMVRLIHLSCIVTFLFGNLLCSSGQEFDFTLSNQAPPIKSTTAIPPLHKEVSEAIGSESGLLFTPKENLDWHRDLNQEDPLLFSVTVDPESFSHGWLTVWNWNNEPVLQFRLESGEAKDVNFRIEGAGSYLITIDGMAEGMVQKRLIRNIAKTADLTGARKMWTKHFFLGICTFPGRYHWSVGGEPVRPESLTEQQARDLEADYMARLGFQVVRIDESMEMGRSKTGGENAYVWNFDRMDAAVDAYVSRGMRLDLQLMNAPDWAVLPKYEDEEEHWWRYPHSEKEQRAFVRALLERYAEHTRFVQIFNEPDQIEFWAGDPEEFVDQFQFTHDEIRNYSKDLPVANGGYAFVDKTKVEYFATELRPFIDFPSYHSHGTLETMRATFDEMKEIHTAAGYTNPQFVNSETGFDAWRLDQERRQAQAVAQKVLYCWANDHRGILLFCGRMAKGPGREDRDLGLLDYEFCPRFSYAAVSGLVSVLAGAEFEKTHLQGEKSFVYEFRNDEDIIVAAFSLEEKGEEFTIQSDATDAVIVDSMGNRDRPVAGRSLSMHLDAYPKYIIFKGARSVGVME